MMVAVLISFLVCMIAGIVSGFRLPLGVYFIMLPCEEVSMVGMCCSFRFYTILRELLGCGRNGERIMLIGAGEAGKVLLREIESSGRVTGKVCCFVDDNPIKRGKLGTCKNRGRPGSHLGCRAGISHHSDYLRYPNGRLAGEKGNPGYLQNDGLSAAYPTWPIPTHQR